MKHPSAFRKALICGQGRAVLHVQRFGSEGVEDLILQAYVKRPDFEVCDSRSEHLCRRSGKPAEMALVDAH
jgi:hypothetical protein